MKLRVTSDLHLEFSDMHLPNPDRIVDLLILSGDICIADKAKKFTPFFQRVTEDYNDVIYIMGNHEHYHGQFDTSYRKLWETFGSTKNLHVLERNSVVIKDITFLGCTLWTDVHKGDPSSMYRIQHGMNDYAIVRVEAENYRKLRPEDTMKVHTQSLEFLDKEIEKAPGDVVVVGHHGPSFQSINPLYKAQYHMNGGYISDLDEFILKRPKVKLWTHGHTHSSFDYFIGSTRIICNPRGYSSTVDGHGENLNFNSSMIIDLDKIQENMYHDSRDKRVVHETPSGLIYMGNKLPDIGQPGANDF